MDRNIVKKINADNLAQWQAWGFPEIPVYDSGEFIGKVVDSWEIVRCVDGKPLLITCPYSHHVAETASTLRDREITLARITSGDRKELVFTTIAHLNMQERYALEILTRYFDHYHPGLKISDKKVIIPEALTGLTAPIEFENEEDAYEAAGVLEEIFRCDAEVTESDGFAIVLDDPDADLEGYNGARLQGICDLLAKYSVQRKAVACSFFDSEDYPSLQANTARRVSQLKRIENALADVSARLDAIQAGKEKTTPPVRRQASAKRRA